MAQFTPGPGFTTATFIGYLLSGPTGALLATVGIFLPAFIFVALSAPLIPKLRASPGAGTFLDGVNVASLALMAVVTWQLGSTALMDWLTILLAYQLRVAGSGRSGGGTDERPAALTPCRPPTFQRGKPRSPWFNPGTT